MRDMRDIVDSYPPASRGRSYEREEHYSSPGVPLFALIVGLPTLLFLLIFNSITDWMLRGILAGFWRAVFPWLSGICIVILLICGAVIAWHIYLVWTNHKLHRGKMQLLKQDLAVKRHTNRLIQEARVNGDNIKLSFGEDGRPKSVEIIRAARATEAQRAVLLGAGQTAVFPEDGYRRIEGQPALLPPPRQPKEQIAQSAESRMPDLPMKGGDQPEEVEEIPLPVAPSFREMYYLLGVDRVPLCYVVEDGESVPAWGTIVDLLSMAVTGKPGRGKTTALMYYICILLSLGAEVWVWDPHGAMRELALLNGKQLPGMPVTAKVLYFDRKDTIEHSVLDLLEDLDARDEYYRPAHAVKHPLLLLADELPVLADFDEKIVAHYKQINRSRLRNDQGELEVPSMLELIKKFVLQARKWNCYFIGSGQSMDAEVLPTRVTENLNSRIVFFSSNRRARMSGLENDAIRDLMPRIRRGGSGVMIFDCSRWDKPVAGAIPMITVKDMLNFLGVTDLMLGTGVVQDVPANDEKDSSVSGTPQLRIVPNGYRTDANVSTERLDDVSENVSDTMPSAQIAAYQGNHFSSQNVSESVVEGPVVDVERVPNTFVAQPGDKLLDELQTKQLIIFYVDCRDVKKALFRIKNERTGEGLGTGYYRHACWILDSRNLRRKRA